MPTCDFKITGASVYDGSGNRPRIMDVAVDRDKIIATGDCADWIAEKTIDATGKSLAPGFIDVHTHDDLAVFKNPDLPFKNSQGITTVIAGNCGISAAPFKPGTLLPAPYPLLGDSAEFVFSSVETFTDSLKSRPSAVNVALLVGHSTLRLSTMGTDLDVSADDKQVRAMKKLLRTSLQQGAIGLSTGLDYPPAAASSTAEVVSLASVLAEFGGSVYATHMRDEGDRIMEAIQETLEIGSRANVPIVISHHKCAGPKNYGRSVQTLAAIDQARNNGQDVMFDVYPYTASASSLLPNFIADSEAVLITESNPYPQCAGRMLDEIAREWSCSDAEAAERLYPAAAIYFQISDQDLERIMSHPAAMIGSDGISNMGKPHPRLWGTFPRVLGYYSRQKKLLSMETAIHKMTGLSAQTFGLSGRGVISEGSYADLVLFDQDTIIDKADFDSPSQLSEGIESVWVNGNISWYQGQSGNIRNGRFLSHLAQ